MSRYIMQLPQSYFCGLLGSCNLDLREVLSGLADSIEDDICTQYNIQDNTSVISISQGTLRPNDIYVTCFATIPCDDKLNSCLRELRITEMEVTDSVLRKHFEPMKKIIPYYMRSYFPSYGQTLH